MEKKRLIKFIGLALFNLPFAVMYLAYKKIVYCLDVKSLVNSEIDDLKSKDISDIIDELEELVKFMTIRYSIPVYMILLVVITILSKRG